MPDSEQAHASLQSIIHHSERLARVEIAEIDDGGKPATSTSKSAAAT